MRIRRPGSRRAELAAGAYCLATTGFIYALWLAGSSYDVEIWALGGVLAATFAVGLAVGAWWVLLLPIVVAILTFPAEFYGSYGGGVFPEGPVAAAIGVGLRKGFEATRRERWRASPLTLALIGAYLGLAVALMAYAASPAGEEGGTWVIVLFLGAHAAFGFGFGKWRSLALVLLLPILAIPVPVPEDAYEPFPLWFAMILWGVPFGAAAMAAGVLVRTGLNRAAKAS